MWCGFPTALPRLPPTPRLPCRRPGLTELMHTFRGFRELWNFVSIFHLMGWQSYSLQWCQWIAPWGWLKPTSPAVISQFQTYIFNCKLNLAPGCFIKRARKTSWTHWLQATPKNAWLKVRHPVSTGTSFTLERKRALQVVSLSGGLWSIKGHGIMEGSSTLKGRCRANTPFSETLGPTEIICDSRKVRKAAQGWMEDGGRKGGAAMCVCVAGA